MPAQSRTLRSEDYHVAWISAIRKEYIIACAMLDEIHNKPVNLREDQRFYIFGCVDGHNVVIAQLLEGTVGIDHAACLATDMANAFPQIRFGLMVGIAGGAPTKENDIRLGDIVVSAPDGSKKSGGVLQYDFGASTQTDGFTRRGLLNRPPPILVGAVGELQSRYDRFGHQIESIVEQTICDLKRGRLDKYRKPNPPTDFLFKPGFIHLDRGTSCAEIGCQSQTDNIVDWKARRTTRRELIVHLGIVGSGGSLVRNAYERDRIAHKEGALCFEMESAGLMNNRLGWLVIRGISDYCDSHKNDYWQNYAAAVAAAYAKDLLNVVPPLRSFQGNVNTINLNITENPSPPGNFLIHGIEERPNKRPGRACNDDGAAEPEPKRNRVEVNMSSGVQDPSEAVEESQDYDLDRYKMLHKSLLFNRIDFRVNNIKKALFSTYEWLFRHPRFQTWYKVAEPIEHTGFSGLKASLAVASRL